MGRAASIALSVSLGLIGFLGMLYAAAYTILLVRLPFHVLTLSSVLLLFIGALLLWGWKTKSADWRLIGISLLPVGAMILLSIWASGYVYDTSFDGQGYHVLASSSMRSGWNPLYHPDFADSIWVVYYPKGAWLTAAAISTLTGHVETGKALNLISMFAAFFASFGGLLQLASFRNRGYGFLRLLPALLIAVCSAANPITLVQLFTNYNDGLIASLLLALVGSAVSYALSGNRKALAIAAIATVFLVNIKFTAIAYAGLICFWLIVAVIARHWTNRKAVLHEFRRVLFRIPVKRAVIVLLGSGVIGLLIFGWNPYVINTVKHGHPFYPLAGKDKIDIMTENSPDDFIGKNRLKTFLLSYTSKTEDAATPRTSHRAELWPIPWNDFHNVNVDTRVAGFGPLSPWILIGSAVLCLLTLAFRWRIGVVSALLAAALLTTVFINPEPWWARYVPQLWLVPLLFVTAAWVSKQPVVRIAGLLLLIVCMADAYKSGDFILRAALKQSGEVKAQLHELAGKRLIVHPEGFTSVSVRLAERGIAYRIADGDPPCEKPVQFAYTPAYYCEQNGE